MNSIIKLIIVLTVMPIYGMGNISAYYNCWMIFANQTSFDVTCAFEPSSLNYLTVSKLVNSAIPAPISLDILGRTLTVRANAVAIIKITRYARDRHLPLSAIVSLRNGSTVVTKNLKMLIEPRNPQRTSVAAIGFMSTPTDPLVLHILTAPEAINIVQKTFYSPLPTDFELTFTNQEMTYLKK